MPSDSSLPSAPVASAPKEETNEKTICRAEEPETMPSPPVLRVNRNEVRVSTNHA